MDRISVAINQLQRLTSIDVAGNRLSDRRVMRHLGICLREDVVPAIDEYVRRPRFQENATWPLRVLLHGAPTPERRQVNVAAELLVQCAGALTRLSQKKLIQRGLGEVARSRIIFLPMTIEAGSTRNTQAVVEQAEQIDLVRYSFDRIKALAAEGVGELVNPADYFEPVQEFVLIDGVPVQCAEFIVSLNPELLGIGNFVSRCLMRRLDLLIEELADGLREISTAIERNHQRYRDWRNLEVAWNELQAARAELARMLIAGVDNQVRNSCIILTQVYAAFHPRPNLAWLSVPIDTVVVLEPLRARLNGRKQVEIIERVALALNDLKRLYPRDLESTSARDEAIAAGKLVIDSSNREVFWAGALIDQPWRRFHAPWNLLETLAKKARIRSAATEGDLYGDKVMSPTAMSSNFSRLKECLPVSLWRQIVPGNDPRSYRLLLEPEQIHFCD